jgi:peptidoglycan endopeptidase LytE
MNLKKRFPCVLTACLLLSLHTATATAQTTETRARQVVTTEACGTNRLENDLEVASADDPIIISLADVAEIKPAASLITVRSIRFEHLLSSAIDDRIGAPYVYGAAGPRVFDCSGFVWSVFQSAGINFDRGSARTIWNRFAPARPDEEFKLGTLVFFSNLSHIGIVADAHGFYHASRSHGVTYSPFNDYWLSRIDGFRRIPMPVQNLAE